MSCSPKSYYIAAINIEAVFDEINRDESYTPLKGLGNELPLNQQKQNALDDSFFGINDERLKRQKEKTDYCYFRESTLFC